MDKSWGVDLDAKVARKCSLLYEWPHMRAARPVRRVRGKEVEGWSMFSHSDAPQPGDRVWETQQKYAINEKKRNRCGGLDAGGNDETCCRASDNKSKRGACTRSRGYVWFYLPTLLGPTGLDDQVSPTLGLGGHGQILGGRSRCEGCAQIQSPV